MSRKGSKPQTGKITGMRALPNLIGDRGENVFELAITDYRDFQHPLFKPGFIGEKWPTVDYYVELLGVSDSTPFFFAQDKSTADPIPSRARTLRIHAEKAKCVSLFNVPGPTYIVGVHEPSRRAFILSLHAKPRQGVYGIPLKSELNPANLRLLHEEVAAFWKSSPHKPSGPYFI